MEISSQLLSASQHRRIQLQLALIPVYLWIVFAWSAYAIDMSTSGRLDRAGHMKGHDFLHFYVLGEIGLERRVDELYSFDAHATRTDRLVPEYEHRFLPIHAPQVALFFAPLARLPYTVALTFWLLLTTVVYGVSVYVNWRSLPALRPFGWLTLLLAVGFPAFNALIAAGQTSAFALAWLTAAYVALRGERSWLAGLALGMLAYKPTLLALVPFALIASRDWRMLAGVVIAALGQFALAAAYFGPSVLPDYARTLSAAGQSIESLEARPDLMHSLKAFFSLLLPGATTAAIVAYSVSAVLVAIVSLRAWVTKGPLELRYAVLLLGSILVNPHVYSYELVVVVPALMAAAAVALQRPRNKLFWSVLVVCYFGVSFGALTLLTRLQVSVLGLLVLLGLLAFKAVDGCPDFPRLAEVPRHRRAGIAPPTGHS